MLVSDFMEAETYLELKRLIISFGYERDVTWAENVGACKTSEDFAREHAFVVCNSGMKAQIARRIFERVWSALIENKDPALVFGHKGKVAAIEHVYELRKRIFVEYLLAEDKLAFLESLPWIGPITKYHLARNFGLDCCKPDRHLSRISKEYETTPEELCQRLAEETGDRVGTVDYVIWQAANLSLV